MENENSFPASAEEDESPRQCLACGSFFDVTFTVMLTNACPECEAALEEECCGDDIGKLFS